MNNAWAIILASISFIIGMLLSASLYEVDYSLGRRQINRLWASSSAFLAIALIAINIFVWPCALHAPMLVLAIFAICCDLSISIAIGVLLGYNACFAAQLRSSRLSRRMRESM